MHPAYSVIFFTTASGAGYGLLALASLAAMSHGQASSPGFALVTIMLGLVLVTAGLLSSTAHLGRPERAWRAFSQWRSSWLSREGVAAVVTYPVVLAFGAVWSGLVYAPSLIAPLGLATAVMCLITVVCTGMIYAQLKTIPAWHNRFTVPVYLVFGLATGALLLSVVSVVFGRFQAGAGTFQVILGSVLLVGTMMLKWVYWRWLDKAGANLHHGGSNRPRPRRASVGNAAHGAQLHTKRNGLCGGPPPCGTPAGHHAVAALPRHWF